MTRHLRQAGRERSPFWSLLLEFGSRAQQPDLNRKVAALSALYPQAEVISEIGSGLNYALRAGYANKRKKLLALLERILSGDVRMVVVTHKDGLARYA